MRRYEETIRNINLLIAIRDKESTIKKLKEHFSPNIEQKKDSLLLVIHQEIPIFISLVDKRDVGTKLVFDTGSKQYVDYLIQHSASKNLYFSSQGLFTHDNQQIFIDNEEKFFNFIELPYLPPELRNIYNDMEVVYKEANKLVQFEDISGIVHCHSQYSDGHNSISELAEYCIEKGYKYIVICDHSQSAGYANGLSVEDIKKQHEEIEQLNKQYKPFHIFKGIECDIKSDGTLDYPDEILSTFDVVIGSIHSKLDMDKKIATQRLLKAIENPYLDVLGHLSGRLLLSRKGYPLDIDTILKVCSEHNVAIEINANPQRLDIDWKNIYLSRKYDLNFVISVDAHNLKGIEDLKYGVYVARKGLLSPQKILNCKNIEEFQNWFHQRT